MKKILAVILTTAFLVAPMHAGFWDNLKKWANPTRTVDIATVVAPDAEPCKKLCRLKALLLNKKTAAVVIVAAASVGGYLLYKKYYAQAEQE